MIINGDQTLPEPADQNFGKYVLDQVKKVKPTDVCLENYNTGEQLTYAELIEYAVGLSVALTDLGLKKGDVVGVGCEKRISYLPTTLAVVLSGAAYTPFDVRTGRAILRHQLNSARPNYFICSAPFWKAYKDIIKESDFIKTIISLENRDDIELSVKNLMSNTVDVDSFKPADVDGQTDIALILYSSGTTGMPKGVLYTHLSCVLKCFPKRFEDESLKTVLTCGEWCHVYDMFTCYAALCVGRKIVFADNLTHDSSGVFPKMIEDCKVNIAAIVPSMVSYLANAEEVDKYDVSSLKTIFSAADALQPNIVKEVLTRLPTIKNVIQIYGMTEAGEMITESWGTRGFKVGSVGMAVPGISLKVVDPKTREMLGANQRGEICIRGPLMMKGYTGMDSSAHLDKEGFFSTGDLGYYDEDEYFFIIGRLKEIICFDGFKLAPLALESILELHPGVREAGVVGKPAGDQGEHPMAFVIRQPGYELTEQELLDYLSTEVPPYMQMRGGVKFVEELPRNQRGKILRRQLKELVMKETAVMTWKETKQF